MIPLPTAPGAYALQLYLPLPRRLRVGQLGEIVFSPAEYIYLGSARGQGGLRARLGRHLRDNQTPIHWHIDYLRSVAEVRAFCYLVLSPNKVFAKPLECCWSQALAKIRQASFPVPGFGASDCRHGCQAHLVAFPPSTDKCPTILTNDLIRQALIEAADISVKALICQNLR